MTHPVFQKLTFSFHFNRLSRNLLDPVFLINTFTVSHLYTPVWCLQVCKVNSCAQPSGWKQNQVWLHGSTREETEVVLIYTYFYSIHYLFKIPHPFRIYLAGLSVLFGHFNGKLKGSIWFYRLYISRGFML